MRGLKRWALAGALAAAATGVLGGAARADDKTVYFLSWGGTIQTMLEKEGWADKFKAETGYTLTLVPKATSAEIMATAAAQKDKPQVDVVMCDLVAYVQGIDQGLFDKLDRSEVPNLAKMVDLAFVRDYGISTYADILAIGYRPDEFKKNGWAPIRDWSDLERPELKGTLIIPPVSNTYGLYYLVELARHHGGGATAIEPGFAALKKLAPGVVDWTTTFAKIGEEMENGMGSVAVFANTSLWEIGKRGVPIEVVVPNPSYMSPTVAGLVRNSPNSKGARALLNWLISEPVLQYRAERFGQSPLNREVKVSAEAAKRVVTGDDLKKLVQIDYEYVLAHRNEWNGRFDREVATIH